LPCFVISYDLPEGSDYDELINAIKSYGTWAHITKSTWAVVTNKNASSVRDHLERFIPEGSTIFVVRSGVESAWRNVICRNGWLKEHL
jgi:hypothetical protein